MFSSLAPRAALTLLLVSAAAACSAPSGADTPDNAPMPTPNPTSMAELHLPLEAYLQDYGHQAKLEVLRFRLRDRCVKAMGFTPPPMTTTGGRAASDYVKLWQFYDTRRYALSDMTTARVYGFHLPPFTGGSAKPISLNSLSVPLQHALEKCDDQVAAKEKQAGISVGHKESDLVDVASGLKAKDFLKSQSDPRVLDVFKSWSSCMAQRGYHYATPQDAAKDQRWTQSGQRSREAIEADVTTEETGTAVAEVECVYSTNLLGVSFAVEAEYERNDIEKNAETLTQLKERTDRDAKKIDELWVRSG
ncbi:hypothetical protein ABZ904_48800 [Streptomyces sp. NPDC046900]|uniref:hypothetical protein n=1 Tax=Streptomyces sp. NPDC046900 TaxID=3155473 RepID=UPI0033F297AD